MFVIKILLPRIERDIDYKIVNTSERQIAFEKNKHIIHWCENKWGYPTASGRWNFNCSMIGDGSHEFYFKNEDDKMLFQLTWG